MTATRAADPALQPAVDAVLPEALDLSHRVHATPEIAFEERQAAQWTSELLARNGFDVTAPAGGLDTAFVVPMMAIAPEGTPGHSREFATHAGGEGGERMLTVAIRVLAASAVELVRNPVLVEQAWSELRAQGGGRRREPSAG